MKIAFYREEKGNWIDHAINIMTKNLGYSHCELVFDNNRIIYDYSDASCFGISGRENKSRFKNINLLNGNWDIYEILFEYNEKEILKECQNYLNKKYDYWGILFGWIIPTKWQDDNKWWCSELTGKLIKLEKFRISPNKLSRIPGIQKWQSYEL